MREANEAKQSRSLQPEDRGEGTAGAEEAVPRRHPGEFVAIGVSDFMATKCALIPYGLEGMA